MSQSSTSSDFPNSSHQEASILSTDSTPSKSRTPRWIFWVIAGIATVLLLCAIIAIVGGFRLFQTSQGATEETLKVVDQFMHAGERKDAATALNLFSPTARDQVVTLQGLAELFATHEEYFTNYIRIQQTSFHINAGTNATTVSLEGAISYDGRPDRKFAATLTKEGEQWKLTGIRLLEEVGQ
jgi:hypothetical protein